MGINRDILFCRLASLLPPELKAKIALYCNIEKEAVITAKDVESIYEVPVEFNKEGLDNKIVEKLNIWTRSPNLSTWEETVRKLKEPKGSVAIAVVGKYVTLKESYKSLNEALTHAGIANDCRVNLHYVDSEDIEKGDIKDILAGPDGIIVPGGFGSRGVEGKITAIRYARENNIPFFGICLGMQLAVIEFARSIGGFMDANSSEFSGDTTHPVIALMETQQGLETMGGTMRLGAYPCRVADGTFAMAAYGSDNISERHRHRFEFNNRFREILTQKGLTISGVSPDNSLVEMVEIKEHPWVLGCQFHPEFKSRPMEPHPLFRDFIKAAIKKRDQGSAGEIS